MTRRMHASTAAAVPWRMRRDLADARRSERRERGDAGKQLVQVVHVEVAGRVAGAAGLGHDVERRREEPLQRARSRPEHRPRRRPHRPRKWGCV